MNKDIPLVYIFNFLEDVVETFCTLDQHKKQQVEEQYSKCYNEPEILSVLSEYPTKQKYYFVFQSNVSQEYLQYACDLLGVARIKIQILVPARDEQIFLGSLSTYLMKDEKLIKKLQKIPQFQLLSFCITDQFLDLCQFFSSKAKVLQNIKMSDWGKIKRYGTKPGIRQLVQKMNNSQIFLPPGKIFYKSQNYRNQVTQYISMKLQKESVVIKTQKFFSGKGVQIIKHQEVKQLDEQQLRHFINKKLKQKFWWDFDIVVQDFIQLDVSVGPPCVQIYVHHSGQISILWCTAMFIGNQKQFEGIQCGNTTFKEQIVEKLNYICQTLGKAYFNIGYRGYINIDLLIDKKGIVYLGESNVRRSGSVYINNFATKAIGREYWREHYVMNHYLYEQKITSISLKNVIRELEKNDLLYNKQQKKGVVVSCSQPTFQAKMLLFFTITSSKQQAIQIGSKIRKMLFQSKFDKQL